MTWTWAFSKNVAMSSWELATFKDSTLKVATFRDLLSGKAKALGLGMLGEGGERTDLRWAALERGAVGGEKSRRLRRSSLTLV